MNFNHESYFLLFSIVSSMGRKRMKKGCSGIVRFVP